MRRNRVALTVAFLSLVLAGCESSSNILDKVQDSVSDFNPFGTGKKPLPGQRKALFPEGVPGVQQGVPSELVTGNQPGVGEDQSPATTASVPTTPRRTTTREETRPKAAPKKSTASREPARPALRPSTTPPEPREDAVWPPPPAPQAAAPWPAQPTAAPPPAAWPTPR